MKTKNITLMIASVFALMFCLAFASAGLFLTPISPTTTTITAGDTSSVKFDFNLSADFLGCSGGPCSTLTWQSNTAPSQGSWTYPSASLINNGTTSQLSATLKNIPYDFNGVINSDINVTDTASGETDTFSISITVAAPTFTQYPFCTGDSSDLELSVDVKNKGKGDDDRWLLLDTIEVEAKMDNNKDSNGQDTYDLEDVTFELGFYKQTSTTNLADDMIWISEDAEEFEFGNIDEGKDGKHTFIFRVNPAEFDEDNYRLMVKASGKDDNNADVCIAFSDDLLNDFSDSAYYADIDIDLENSKDEMVIIDTETFPQPATASCEQEVTFTADVWNIGDKDFEDQVLVTLNNDALGVSQNTTFNGDLDAGDTTQVTFTFNVPAGMTEKQYDLEMKTYYDYDVDNAEYDEVSKDSFIFPLSLSGNCIQPEATMVASLESGGQAGDELVVRATITNSGLEESTYTFGVTGYSTWASTATVNLTSTTGQSLTLGAGQSQDILITLDVDRQTDAGDQIFDVVTYSEGQVVLTQPVQVAITDKPGLFSSDNGAALPILIALISAAAIAVIIVLIVRASRKK